MRSPISLRRAAGATLSAGILLAAGCAQDAPGGGSGTKGTADAQEVVLQPAAERGPDPFTGSTARLPGAVPAPSRTGPRAAPAPGGPAVHRLTGSTPGLYGGTRSVASCDVGKQIRFLAADRARGEAFARAAGIAPAGIAGFLRGLTPVLLRADTRVAGHGFSGGAATTVQSVLQAGTAVMVDRHGLPRVRCVCGNPLTPPNGARAAAGRGEGWTGYDPERTVVVEPTAREVTALVIVDVDNNAWIERRAGDGAARDRAPEVPPPYGPGTDITGQLPGLPPAEPTPSGTTAPTDCPTPGVPTPPGEEAAATASPSAAPSGTPGDDPAALPPGCPTDPPSPDPTDEPSGAPSESVPDEPPGVPAEPDEPPGGLVPPMDEEPQTAIELPWPDDTGGAAEPVAG
ncbi:DUF6777 domain-containing protein [Streptomyces brevispora]|uniref:DUF6777 domain-containing protein n=1 Tax=Streptomyces brevispora TaxID=887462 RepID=UPI003802D852